MAATPLKAEVWSEGTKHPAVGTCMEVGTNAMAEVGFSADPPIQPDLPGAFRDIAVQLQTCDLLDDQLYLSESPVCQAYGLGLTDDPPVRPVDEILTSLEEALHELNRRLRAFAIGQVLEQPNTAMVDKFLKIIRASHLETLVGVLDDQVAVLLGAFVRQS